MRKLIIVSLFMFWAFCKLNAQIQPVGIPNKPTNFNKEIEKTDADQDQLYQDQIWEKHLIINSDSRIDTLIQIHREENTRKGGIEGYRVQIFQGTKDDAYRAKAKFISIYENINVYVIFQSPDFRVWVGDFRTKSEAIKLKYIIKNDFSVVYIVGDNINLPELVENGTDK